LIESSRGTQLIQLLPLDFWRDFSIRLVQGETAAPKKIAGRPIGWPLYSRSGLIGVVVELEFDAAQVTSAPARIEVLTPDGQKVAAEFDLEKLR
jgi:hypothetical protein